MLSMQLEVAAFESFVKKWAERTRNKSKTTYAHNFGQDMPAAMERELKVLEDAIVKRFAGPSCTGSCQKED